MRRKICNFQNPKASLFSFLTAQKCPPLGRGLWRMMESMENIYIPGQQDQKLELPSGFRFHPTDEELINYYLIKKVLDRRFSAIPIADVDLNKCEPWDLPGLAKMGETEWYFFCVRDKKYPTGQRTNRATDAGYWKATGKDKEIISIGNTKIGMKKTLVFYKGRAPRGEKTNWVMHEYRLEGNHSECTLPRPERSEWVICRVFEKSHSGKGAHVLKFGRLNPLGEEPLPTPASPLIPPLMDSSSSRTTPGELSQVTCFSEPNQADDRNNTHDDIVDSRETPILNFSSASSMPPSDISPASWGFAKQAPAASNDQSTQIAHQIGNPQCQPDYSLPQEPSMLRMMTENHGSSSRQNQKAESSQERDFDVDISSLLYNNDMFYRFFGIQEHSSASAEPVDFGDLWN